MDNQKIEITLHKRQLDSFEKLSNELVKQLFDIITNYKIPIIDNTVLIANLNNMTYENSVETFSDKITSIKLDNSQWKKKYG